MTRQNPKTGYAEVDHTADWALRVWSDSLGGLFSAAAEGMFDLMKVSGDLVPATQRRLVLDAPDTESLLVAFLTEVLHILDEEQLALEPTSTIVNRTHLEILLEGRTVLTRVKEIKAVTFHNLEICEDKNGFECTLVFDV